MQDCLNVTFDDTAPPLPISSVFTIHKFADCREVMCDIIPIICFLFKRVCVFVSKGWVELTKLLHLPKLCEFIADISNAAILPESE